MGTEKGVEPNWMEIGISILEEQCSRESNRKCFWYAAASLDLEPIQLTWD